MSLKKTAIKSGKWVAISSVIVTLLQLFQFSIISKFLTKADFGIISLLMVAFSFGLNTVNGGLSNSIIAIKEISHKQISSLFWLNLIVGLSTYGILFLISPYFCILIKSPELVAPLRLFLSIFIVFPLGQIYEFLLRKDLQFKAVSMVDIMGSVLEISLSVFLAMKGFGVYAFVLGKILYFASRSIILFFLGTSRWHLNFYLNFKIIKEYINFGFYQLGSCYVFVLYSQMPKFVITPLLGLEVMGLFELANKITIQPVIKILPIIHKVTFPLMAKLQSDINKIRGAYGKYIQTIQVSILPILIILVVFAKPIVFHFYGNEWLEVVPFVQLLSIATYFRCLNTTFSTVTLSVNKPKLDFFRTIIAVSITALITYFGVKFWKLDGAIYSTLIATILISAVGYFLILPKVLGNPLPSYLKKYLSISLLLFSSFLLVITFNSLVTLWAILAIFGYALLSKDIILSLIKTIKN